MKLKKDDNFLKGRFIAHCGVHNIENKIPENSIKAFEIAISKGYLIELDVHILKDNTVIVFHDDNLLRMTGVNKKINKCIYSEIKDLKLQKTESHIPTFKEVLNLVDGKVPLIIELKYDTRVGRLENKVMEELYKYKGKYAIHSFNPLSLLFLKNKFPNVIRGQISCDFRDIKMNIVVKWILKSMCLNKLSKPDFISYDINSLPNNKIERYRKKRIVLGWTIKNKNDLEKARKYCDNYICENIL